MNSSSSESTLAPARDELVHVGNVLMLARIEDLSNMAGIYLPLDSS